MSAFSKIAHGARQVDVVELALAGIEKPARVGVRVLLSHDDDDILCDARAFAIKQGVSDPKDGNPIYDLALARYTIALACVDPDSDGQRAPFFADADEVRTGLDRDRIAYLYARQQRWQDECSPLKKSMGEVEYMHRILRIAEAGEEDQSPFADLAPGMLESLLRTSAKQLVILATPRSPSGSVSIGNGVTATRSPDHVHVIAPAAPSVTVAGS